jgi:hypothetical protein
MIWHNAGFRELVTQTRSTVRSEYKKGLFRRFDKLQADYRCRVARARLRGPEPVDLEVASVLRRQMQGGEVDIRCAALALADLAALPLRRAPHRPRLAQR